MKRIAVFFLCLALFFSFNNILNANQAATGAGIDGLDISSGIVNGDRVEYVLSIPEDWLEFIIVEREALPPDAKIIEKLNLYFQPKNLRPVLLCNFFVIETRYSEEIGAYKRILETDEFDFRAYVSASEPNFSNAGEQIIFDHIIGQLHDFNFCFELFSFPDGKGPIVKDMLHVNGRLIEGSVIYDSNQPFVPLRAACEALGYNVVWRGGDASILMEKNGASHVLYTAGRQNYGAVRVENSFYVPALFFVSILKTSFETDKHGNVFITERAG